MKIYILYQHVAHYREPIFTELIEHSELTYEIISDDIAFHTKALKTVKSFEKPNWTWNKIDTFGILIKGHEFIWQPAAVKILLKRSCDLIILLGDPHFISNWIILIICKIKKIPVLNWGIGVMRPENGLKWFIRKTYLKLFDRHLLYGNWAKDYLVTRGFNKDLFTIVYNSLDYKKMKVVRNSITKDKTQRVKETITKDSNAYLLFHSGRLVKRKKIDFIINAISILKNHMFNVHLLVVGDGPEMSYLQNYCINNKVKERIHFFGSCYDEYTLALLMSACDASVVAGQLGLFAIQSLTFGLPVITHNNKKRISGPESESIIDKKTGFIYEQDDIGSFVKCLIDFITSNVDRNYHQNACYSMVEEFYNPQKQAAIINEAVVNTYTTYRGIAR